MSAQFHYFDPRGRQSGPFTEAELTTLASRGMLERDGMVQLDGAPSMWRVEDVGWLKAALNPAGSAGEAPPPPMMEQPSTPPQYQPAPPTPVADANPACARSTFILLAILPPFLGVFGIHNVVAGYTSVGILQLVLSLFTIGGFVFGPLLPPCCCSSCLLYTAMFVWVVVEASTVTTDARGRTLRV